MAIELYDASNEDGLFNILGQLFYILEKTDEWKDGASGLSSHVTSFITTHHKRTWTTLDKSLVDPVIEGYESERDNSVMASAVQQSAIDLLHAVVEEDADQPERSVTNSIDYLIDQMTTQTHYVDANVGATSLATGGSNVGDTGVMYTDRDDKGYNLQNVLAEATVFTVDTVGSSGEATIATESTTSVSKLSHRWPKGSGLLTTVSSAIPTSHTHVENGNFKTQTYDNLPDNWIVGVGTLGTTLKISEPEKQTVVIAGTPTTGTYILKWTHPNGNTYSTIHLTYNASGSVVQSALRNLPGLSLAEVTTTGTTPNYTHTIEFKGTEGGNVATLDGKQFDMGGTINYATTTTGKGFRGGYALEFDSNGSELTAIYTPLNDIESDTCYFLTARTIRVGAASGGAIKFDIVSGIGGSILTDTKGNSLTKTVNAADIVTSGFSHQWMAMSVKPSQARPIYLKIHVSSAITNTASIYFDDVAVVPSTQLYTGGPRVAFVTGKTDAAKDDTWTLTTTNDRAGEFQTMFDRVYNMAALGKYLPTSGSTAIPDSLIA
jgi:hypothetical protein